MHLPGTSRRRKNRWKMSKVKQCLLTFLNFKFCQNDTFCQAMTIKSKWEKGQFLLTRQQRIIKCSPRQKCSGLKTCFVAEMFAQPPPTPPGGQTPHLLLADNIHPSWRSTFTPPVVSLHTSSWQTTFTHPGAQPPPLLWSASTLPDSQPPSTPLLTSNPLPPPASGVSRKRGKEWRRGMGDRRRATGDGEMGDRRLEVGCGCAGDKGVPGTPHLFNVRNSQRDAVT